MAIIDGPRKLHFLLEQASVAATLADAVPDPAARRLTASGVFVALDSFIDMARRVRNEIPPAKEIRSDLEEAKRALNALADRDWGPYAPLRDRLSAHRQPLGNDDGVAAWAAANELWGQVDAPLIGVLLDDMAAIYALLAPLCAAPPFSPPSLPQASAAAIAQASGFQPREGVSIASGNFGETMAQTISPLQGGAVGHRLREIGDTIDAMNCFGEISQCVVGAPSFGRAAFRGAIIETQNIVELVFELPAGRAPTNRFDPLVELIPATYAEAAELRAERARLRDTDLRWLSGLRNSVAAHVDASTPFAQLLAGLDAAPAARINGIFETVCQALQSVDQRHPISILSPLIRLHGKRLEGVERVDPPEHNRPYDGA